MSNEDKTTEKILNLLEDIKKLLQQSIAIQLYKEGATQDEITKNLRITKQTINSMVKGIKKIKVKSYEQGH